MSETVVHAENLAKRYRIGEYRGGYETLRDTIAHTTRRLMRLEHRPHYEEIWALRDVSFDIGKGEVVGFIGRNGAGKSTLLKILTRITPPTQGRAEITGRVGSILEVGTGFHPELTGRENTYLNGSILGMTRREINRKFPEILEFSGVEKFIDTPVKRYSTGMYVRLAFAVAAHLDPEILLIDEVLAVGDYEFQQRCMGRIEDISKTGRTVIFVSHDLQAVARLCGRAYWIENGVVAETGASKDVVATYLQAMSGAGAERSWEAEEAPVGHDVKLRSARIVGEDGRTVETVDVRSRVGVEIAFTVLHPGFALFPKIKLTTAQGDVAFNALDTDARWREPAAPGDYVATAWIPANLLNEGLMSVDVGIASAGASRLTMRLNLQNLLTFHVHDPSTGDSAKGPFTGQLRGVVRPLLEWTSEGPPGSR